MKRGDTDYRLLTVRFAVQDAMPRVYDIADLSFDLFDIEPFINHSTSTSVWVAYEPR
jgi:hypothetical protein